MANQGETQLLGSTGLEFETPETAVTGYVLAKDAWGRGYATEALTAMVTLARNLGVARLCAQCHCDHAASIQVLEKCGFRSEGTLRDRMEFPNLAPGRNFACLLYSQTLLQLN